MTPAGASLTMYRERYVPTQTAYGMTTTTTTTYIHTYIHTYCGYLGNMWRSRVLFWGAPLPNADQLTGFCVHITIVLSLMISMVNVFPRPRHTCEGDRNLNPHNIVLGAVLRRSDYLYAYEPHRRSTGGVLGSLQFEVYISRKRWFVAPQTRAAQGMPKHKTFSG